MSRQTKGAHARKQPKQQDNSFFSFIPKEKRKTALIIAIVAVVVIVALFFIIKAALAFSENDLVVKNSDGKLRSAGKFAGTDKYTLDPSFTAGTYDEKHEWTYRGGKGDPIYYMRVYAKSGSAKEAYDLLLTSYSAQNDDGETVFNGFNGEGENANGLRYLYFISEPIEIPNFAHALYLGVNTTDYFQKRIYAFVETAPDACAVVAVMAKSDTQDELASDEALIERCREFLDLITGEEIEGAQPIYADDGGENMIPAGYFLGTDKYGYDADYKIPGQDNSSSWKYDGEQDDPIYFMYVTGSPSSAKTAVDRVIERYSTIDEETGETIFGGSTYEGTNANGLKYYWTTSGAQPEYDTTLASYGITFASSYAKYSFAFVETKDELSAMVAVYGRAESQRNLPSDEALLERAKEFVDLISK